MPPTEVTLSIPEAKAAAAIKALCNQAGLPVSAANAKLAIARLLKRTIEGQLNAEAASAAEPGNTVEVT